jgi:hypothetical protein
MTTRTNASRDLATLVADWIATDGYLPEDDHDINDGSRAVIAEMAAAHGGVVWLGRVNRVPWNPGEHRYWILGGEPVENFGASFVAPTFDHELDDLIRQREQAEYTGTRDDRKRLEAIYARLADVGGEILIWT